ncbi:porin [Hoeflea sp.]|uniref:porin n=1 Tax=Hoeflea sp. TaxID=1940281 RepID=UPI003A930E50
MNIKSLLIGSAAALVAVSGARAADAIVAAEPEPVEYVRVCDAFGTGFFYIPGTETCLRIDGYVRVRVGGSRYKVAGNEYIRPSSTNAVLGRNEGYTRNTRARINFDARSETELGTLRGYIRVQSDSGIANSDAAFSTDQAMIQLGGLFMGYTESAFAALWGGGVGNWGFIQTDAGGSYGYQQRQQIGYRYDADSFYAALVLENDNTATLATNNWTPDVVGVLGVSQGWGGAFMHLGYDESNKAVAVKAGVQFDVAATGGSVRLGGFYSNKVNNSYGLGINHFDITEVANWSAAIGYTQDITDTVNATIGYQYFDGFSVAKGGVVKHAHLIEGAISWTPVTNFNVRLEGNYGTAKTYAGVKATQATGFVWVRRSF